MVIFGSRGSGLRHSGETGGGTGGASKTETRGCGEWERGLADESRSGIDLRKSSGTRPTFGCSSDRSVSFSLPPFYFLFFLLFFFSRLSFSPLRSNPFSHSRFPSFLFRSPEAPLFPLTLNFYFRERKLGIDGYLHSHHADRPGRKWAAEISGRWWLVRFFKSECVSSFFFRRGAGDTIRLKCIAI